MVEIQDTESVVRTYTSGPTGDTFSFQIEFSEEDQEELDKDDIEYVVDSPLGVETTLLQTVSATNSETETVSTAPESQVYFPARTISDGRRRYSVRVKRSDEIPGRGVWDQSVTIAVLVRGTLADSTVIPIQG